MAFEPGLSFGLLSGNSHFCISLPFHVAVRLSLVILHPFPRLVHLEEMFFAVIPLSSICIIVIVISSIFVKHLLYAETGRCMFLNLLR